MILAIDMGNTNLVIGCIDDEKTYFVERLSTDRSKTALEYSIGFKTVLDIYHIDPVEIQGAVLSSVVPQLTYTIREAVTKILGKEPLIVGPGVKTGLNVHMDNPKSVGSDLIVDSVAGIAEYGVPLIVIDMGTATTMTVVDQNKTYIGGAILPGLRVSLDALTQRASQLSNVSLDAPQRIIGKNTTDSMKSGLILGNAACIDGMIDRMEEELGYKTTVIATGGLTHVVIPHCKHEIHIDDSLLLKGLKIIYDKNREEGGR